MKCKRPVVLAFALAQFTQWAGLITKRAPLAVG